MRQCQNTDILASQIASGNADRLSAFLLNTDSPAITQLTDKVALDSFLAKHPVVRFEMLSAGRNPHVMLAWLAGSEGQSQPDIGSRLYNTTRPIVRPQSTFSKQHALEQAKGA